MAPDDLMTAAELRVVREHLGLTRAWLANHLGVQERSVARWEDGQYPIPDGIRVAVEELEARTAEVVTAGVDACHDANDPALITYRSDANYRQHHPEQGWPASWHRQVCARIAAEVPGLPISFWRP